MKVLLIVYDNDSYMHWFQMGTAYIASALRDAGYYVEIYNQDVYHYPEEHLYEFLKENKYDAVGMGAIGGYYQYAKLLKISEVINRLPNKPFYFLGGHGASPEPEYFLRKTKADVVIKGEGEVTVVELLKCIKTGSDLSSVNGIAYLKNNILYKTTERELIKNVDSISYPAWDLFPIDYYSLMREPHIENHERLMPVLSARGCPYKCNFCYRMDKGVRLRSDESLIKEISILKEKYNIGYIVFLDELLMTSEKRTIKLCNSIIDSGLKFKWNCSGRLNFAKPDVLNKMKEAGCVFINYGIESYDDQALANMNKKLTEKEIKEGIEATLEAGISPGFNIIWGNIGESKETLMKGVDFLLKYDDCSQMRTIRPVTPYPGSPLYYYAIDHGLLEGVADFYENKHLNSDLLAVNFTNLTDDEFHKSLYEANKVLIDNYLKKKKISYNKQLKYLYLGLDKNFRGFRHT
jgi:anaerobic magnesium-protoporphyrin IX monomethyl ester cyclase